MSEPLFGSDEDVNPMVEGAKIERLEAREGGFHLVLQDGRTLVLVDCIAVAVCASKDFWQ